MSVQALRSVPQRWFEIQRDESSQLDRGTSLQENGLRGAFSFRIPENLTVRAQTTEEIEYLVTLYTARSICDLLTVNAPIITVANASRNLNAFGMGHTLFNIAKKCLFENSRTTIDDVIAAVIEHDNLNPVRKTTNRMRLLEVMKKTGLINPKQHDRHFKPAGTVPSGRRIGQLVEEHCKVPYEQIISASRAKPVVKARFRAIWVVKTVSGQSLSTIGKQFGGRDHTTVLNSINKIMEDMKTDLSLVDEIGDLCESADLLGVEASRAMLLQVNDQKYLM